MSKLKYLKVLDEIKKRITKLEEMSAEDAQHKLTNGFTKAEVRLNSIAVYILMETSKKKSNEAKLDMIEELSDALNIKEPD